MDLVKVIKVIKSCKTKEQREAAEIYYSLFLKKYNYDISNEYQVAIRKLLS